MAQGSNRVALGMVEGKIPENRYHPEKKYTCQPKASQAQVLDLDRQASSTTGIWVSGKSTYPVM